MRHLVYLLLVANLVYLGWNVFASSTAPEPVRQLPPLPALVSPLVTLQERETDADTDSADEVSSIEALTVEQPLAALESPQVALQEREVGTGTDSADEVSSIGTLTVEQPPGAGAAILCQALGPFLVVSDLEVVESRLIDLGLQPTQRELESKELNGYWVYLSAMPREDVQAVLAILEKHKDKEYYVGKQNFISLGTFKGITRAERRLKETRKMGLDATLEKRFTTQSTWWLDIQSDGAATEQMSRIVANRPELQLVELACY